MIGKGGDWWIRGHEDKVGENGVIGGECGHTKDIGAVQVLDEWVRDIQTVSDGDNGSRRVDRSHTSFELNLIFNDGTRKTLQDGKNYSLVDRNANKIAKYLGIPVWK